MSDRRVRPGELLRLAVIALFFLAAPTAGDIGSCSQTASDLDPAKFFDEKQNVDCQRCLDCGITSQTCANACGPTIAQTFPDHCFPVVHDGEVCLDALRVASCKDYEGYMADQGRTTPTECDFCPLQPIGDAGADQ